MQTTSRRIPAIPRSSDDGQRVWDACLALTADVERSQTARGQRTGDEALLFSYLSIADPDPQWRARAVQHLNAAIDNADALCSAGKWGLNGGLAGLGWNVEHIGRLLAPNPDADRNADTDAALVRELERGRWKGTCDLESGLAGIGVYFLERLPARSAAAGLKLVVDHLGSQAFNPGPSGLSHAVAFDVTRGLPGMMYVLAEAAVAGIEGQLARELLERAGQWLRDHDAPSAPLSWSRDLGTIAIALHCATITTRSKDHEFATDLLERCLGVSPMDSGINDVSLRNGTAGIAHAFQRLATTGGDPRCGRKALEWYERTLTLLDRGEAAFVSEGDAFLDGEIGTALAILAASADVEPMWDRRLALYGRTS